MAAQKSTYGYNLVVDQVMSPMNDPCLVQLLGSCH